MDKDSPVWQVDSENKWKLYKNTDYKLPTLKDKEEEDSKNKNKNKAPVDSPFFFNKIKQEVKGTVICTPKGYGIIQAIDTEKNLITVKVQGIIYEFDKNEVMNELPITIVFLKEGTKLEEVIYVPVNSTIKELIERVESSRASDENLVDVKLYFEGKELEKSDETLEKLKLNPYSKFLATSAMGKPSLISRFTSSQNGWCIGGGGIDGISFQVSKNIRVIGFGLYPPTTTGGVECNLKLYAGDNTKSPLLWSQTTTISKIDGEPDNKAVRVLFDKPYALKVGKHFSCTAAFTTSSSCHYGNGGGVTMTGENDVSFTFKGCTGAHNGTSTGSGQIPEIYYYV